MAPRNPFKPTAGASPPLLVGRQQVLDEFVESIEDGPGAPGRLMLLTGPRGVGKTVMLTEVSDQASQLGWASVAETAADGLVGRLTRAVARLRTELDTSGRGGRGISHLAVAGIGGVTLDPPVRTPPDLREQLGALLDNLERHGTGLLITVDEVHRQARGELRVLAATIQHLIREDREVALVMAGLPSAVSELLGDPVITFLRRAVKEELSDVALADVRDALRTTIETSGRSIVDTALGEATSATGGYPFMIQLVGHSVWRRSLEGVITLEAVREAIPIARRRLGSTVHETALADLSAVDRTYLLAMAHDDGPSRTSEIAARLAVTVKYASTYRLRLIDARVIEPVGHGQVDFAIPTSGSTCASTPHTMNWSARASRIAASRRPELLQSPPRWATPLSSRPHRPSADQPLSLQASLVTHHVPQLKTLIVDRAHEAPVAQTNACGWCSIRCPYAGRRRSRPAGGQVRPLDL